MTAPTPGSTRLYRPTRKPCWADRPGCSCLHPCPRLALGISGSGCRADGAIHWAHPLLPPCSNCSALLETSSATACRLPHAWVRPTILAMGHTPSRVGSFSSGRLSARAENGTDNHLLHRQPGDHSPPGEQVSGNTLAGRRKRAGPASGAGAILTEKAMVYARRIKSTATSAANCV